MSIRFPKLGAYLKLHENSNTLKISKRYETYDKLFESQLENDFLAISVRIILFEYCSSDVPPLASNG